MSLRVCDAKDFRETIRSQDYFLTKNSETLQTLLNALSINIRATPGASLPGNASQRPTVLKRPVHEDDLCFPGEPILREPVSRFGVCSRIFNLEGYMRAVFSSKFALVISVALVFAV